MSDAGPRNTASSIELLGIEPLEEHARRLAALLTVSVRPTRRQSRASEAAAPARARASTGLHIARRRRQTRRAVVASRRMAARQFSHRSRGPSRHPARPAARLFPAASADRRRRVRGSAPHLRDGARAHSMQRGTPRPATLAPLRHGIPVGHAVDHGRALGVAVRLEARARRTLAHPGRRPRDEPRPPSRCGSTGRGARHSRACSPPLAVTGSSRIRHTSAPAFARTRDSRGSRGASSMRRWTRAVRPSRTRFARKRATRQPNRPSWRT